MVAGLWWAKSAEKWATFTRHGWCLTLTLQHLTLQRSLNRKSLPALTHTAWQWKKRPRSYCPAVRGLNGLGSKWVMWRLPGDREKHSFWNHAVGASAVKAAVTTPVMVYAWNGNKKVRRTSVYFALYFCSWFNLFQNCQSNIPTISPRVLLVVKHCSSVVVIPHKHLENVWCKWSFFSNLSL